MSLVDSSVYQTHAAQLRPGAISALIANGLKRSKKSFLLGRRSCWLARLGESAGRRRRRRLDLILLGLLGFLVAAHLTFRHRLPPSSFAQAFDQKARPVKAMRGWLRDNRSATARYLQFRGDTPAVSPPPGQTARRFRNSRRARSPRWPRSSCRNGREPNRRSQRCANWGWPWARPREWRWRSRLRFALG
jgi:hypothetical protein